MRPEPIKNGELRHSPRRSELSAAPAKTGLIEKLYQRARDQYRLGNIDSALRILDKVFDQQSGPLSRRIIPLRAFREAAILRGWCFIETKQHNRLRPWLDEAAQLGFIYPEDEESQVLELNLQILEENYSEVQDRAEVLLSRRAGQKSQRQPSLVQAELRLLLGAALRWQGQTNEALNHVEFAVQAFGFLQEPGRQAVAANFLGWTFLSRGTLEEARRWFEKSLQLNSGLGLAWRLAQNYQNLAIVCYKQGQYDRAIDLLTNEIDLVDSQAMVKSSFHQQTDMLCRARLALGYVYRLQGQLEGARTELMKAYSLANEANLVREQILSLEYLGDVLRDEGQPAQAKDYYGRGMALARDLAPRGDLVMELLRREGECLDLTGQHEEALHVLNDALQLCREVGDRFETAVTLRCLGSCAANLGRWKQAADHLRSALEALSALGARQEAMIARHNLAQVLIRQVDTGNAGAQADRLVDEAWNNAMRAQQCQQDLKCEGYAQIIDDLVANLAQRKFGQTTARKRPEVFSSHRAAASRVIATSTVMQDVLRRCDGFAGYDNPVLLFGESGTGKELLARRIHELSSRSSKPFVRVGCATSSASALAKEIFGQTVPRPQGPEYQPGLLEQADGGTLMLSGIEDLPLQLQDKLLHFFQESTFRPEGDPRDRRSNVRILATTRKDLGALVAQGRFRANLHFRLRLMAVDVPPLVRHMEDLIPLLEHCLARLEGSSLPARSLFDFQALEAMALHRWPGNVAEVEAIAQQAWINRNLGLPVTLRRIEGPVRASLEFTSEEITTGGQAPLLEGKSESNSHPSGMTWSALMALIEKTGGNKSKVARHLGISRITLYRWLDQLQPEGHG